MLEVVDTKRHKRHFDSLLDILAWLDQTPRVWTVCSSRNMGDDDRSWSLGHSYADCLRLAREGWEHGVAAIAAQVATVPTGYVYEQRYDVAGELPDVPRYLAGDPRNMVTRGKVRKPKGAVSIAVNIRANSMVSAQEMVNFGAAIAVIIDRLESRGVRVELLGLYGDDGKSHRHCYSWVIKHAQDPLDLSAVAFSLAHPGMFRRIGFAIAERSRLENETFAYGFGGGISADDFIDPPEGLLMINGVDNAAGQCRRLPDAIKLAEDRINAAAIAATGEPIAELEELS